MGINWIFLKKDYKSFPSSEFLYLFVVSLVDLNIIHFIVYAQELRKCPLFLKIQPGNNILIAHCRITSYILTQKLALTLKFNFMAIQYYDSVSSIDVAAYTSARGQELIFFLILLRF